MEHGGTMPASTEPEPPANAQLTMDMSKLSPDQQKCPADSYIRGKQQFSASSHSIWGWCVT